MSVYVRGAANLYRVVGQQCCSCTNLFKISFGHSLSTGENHYYFETISTLIALINHFFNIHDSETLSWTSFQKLNLHLQVYNLSLRYSRRISHMDWISPRGSPSRLCTTIASLQKSPTVLSSVIAGQPSFWWIWKHITFCSCIMYLKRCFCSATK